MMKPLKNAGDFFGDVARLPSAIKIVKRSDFGVSRWSDCIWKTLLAAAQTSPGGGCRHHKPESAEVI